MVRRSHNRFRTAAAWVCLLAVALLYAPVAAVAWPALDAACCTGNQCKVAEHHHRDTPQKHEAERDCGHEMAGMSACAMSCCRDSERALMAATAFLLPVGLEIQASEIFTVANQVSRCGEIPNPFEPLSPPPRSFAALL